MKCSLLLSLLLTVLFAKRMRCNVHLGRPHLVIVPPMFMGKVFFIFYLFLSGWKGWRFRLVLGRD